MNLCALIGTLCHEPEMRKAQDGMSMTSFRIAVRRDYKNAEGAYDSDFINCKAFKHNAEFVCKFAHKGDRLGVTGRIQTGSYTKQDGTKVYTTDVMVNDVKIVKAKDGESKGAAAPKDDGFKEVEPGDDLPF